MNKTNKNWISMIAFLIVAIGLTVGLFSAEGDIRAKQFTCEEAQTNDGFIKVECEKPEKPSK